MLLIPELEKILLLVPRTGTTALKNAILEAYPKSMLLYRHMEADGVPQGYDRWEKIGVVRHPIARLWSLYKYTKNFDHIYVPDYTESLRQSVVGMDFSTWILRNTFIFANAYGTVGLNHFHVQYTVRHPIPETMKSQFLYLRPDLGTRIYKFTDLAALECDLNIRTVKCNHTEVEPMPRLTDEAYDHIQRFFNWDLKMFEPKE